MAERTRRGRDGSGRGETLWTSPRRIAIVATITLLAVLASLVPTTSDADAQVAWQRISGEGSSWSAGFVDAMRADLAPTGMTVDYNPSGSTAGRRNFLNGTADFAVSDLPFQRVPEDGSPPESPGSSTYIPITAGGLAFPYNLIVDGRRVTELRLSGDTAARIFTGAITNWNDPALAADNPGLDLPDRPITPVVHAEGAGTTRQLTEWMAATHGSVWQDYCTRSGRVPACGPTAFYPTIPGMVAQAGDLGVVGYITQFFADGAIGYANYSYTEASGLPVAKVLNAAGYYTGPTPTNVAVSLLQARVVDDPGSPDFQTHVLDDVYADTDPRNYPLSSYSYLIAPTLAQWGVTEAKGRTLAAFTHHALCEGQQRSAALGYAPMPVNLVEAAFEQVARIPGAEPAASDLAGCTNPTIAPDGSDLLAATAPYPLPCDRQGPYQCGTVASELPPSQVVVQTITGDRPPGALVLSQDCGSDPACTVDLGTGVLEPDGTAFAATGSLRAITITDTRDGDVGWTVTGDVDDVFTTVGDAFDARALGWSPRLVYDAPPAPDGYDPTPETGPPIAPDSGDALVDGSAVLLRAQPGAGLGRASATADLVLRIPVSALSGVYQARLTISAA